MHDHDKNKTKEDCVSELVAMGHYCFNMDCFVCDELKHCKDDQLYINSMWRLYNYGKIIEEDVHRDLGKYFRYPQCCIDNFVRLNNLGEMAGVYMREKYGESKNKNKDNYKHVECAKCRTKKEPKNGTRNMSALRNN
jgi:hypothetical protein